MRLYGTLTKVDKEQRVVAGYASTEAVDAHGEIVTKAAIEAALDGYLEFSNVREMHQLSAVGVTEEASIDDRGLYIAAKITDDAAWAKVVSGTYKGFSIGGRTLARDPDDKKIITKILLTEISLVDRPSNPEARFDVWKAAGGADPITKIEAALDVADAAIATVAKPTGVKKSIYHVGRFAELLESLSYMASSLDNEAAFEADDSPVPEQLREWLTFGAAIFHSMAEEEIAEFVAQFKVEKAAPSGKDLGRIAGGRGADSILKGLQQRDAEIDQLRKGVIDRDAEIERLNKILAEPAPPKTAGSYGFVAVSKEDDVGGNGLQKAKEANESDLVAALGAMSEEDRALLLIKAAQRLPGRVSTVPAR